MLSKGRIGGALLLLFCAVYGWLIADIRLMPFQQADPFTARTMPTALAVLGAGLAALVLFTASDRPPQVAGLRWGRVALFLGLMSLYGATVRPLGFLLATSAFLMIGFALLGERRPLTLLAVAVPIVVLFWVLMTQGLDVWIDPLPRWL